METEFSLIITALVALIYCIAAILLYNKLFQSPQTCATTIDLKKRINRPPSRTITDLPTEILEKNLFIFLSRTDLRNIGMSFDLRFKLIADKVAMKRDFHIAVIGGQGTCFPTGNFECEIEVLLIQSDGTITASNCQLPPLEAHAAQGERLLICGECPPSNRCIQFDSDRWQWMETEKMKDERLRQAMTSVNDTFFVSGGLDASYKTLNSFEKFDQTWKSLTPLPTPLHGHCMISINRSEIVCIGGRDESGTETNAMYRYRIQENRWDTWTPMSEKRYGHSCLVLKREVIVVGGYYMKTSEIFNVGNERWRPGPDLPTTISNAQLVKAPPGFKYVAFLIGGYDQSGQSAFSSAIYGLNNDISKFIHVGNIKRARGGHVALVLPSNVVEKCETTMKNSNYQIQ